MTAETPVEGRILDAAGDVVDIPRARRHSITAPRAVPVAPAKKRDRTAAEYGVRAQGAAVVIAIPAFVLLIVGNLVAGLMVKGPPPVELLVVIGLVALGTLCAVLRYRHRHRAKIPPPVA